MINNIGELYNEVFKLIPSLKRLINIPYFIKLKCLTTKVKTFQ
jgi:hypothetical protein